MFFENNFIEYLKSAVRISDLISKKIKLKKRGNDYLGLCPFHNEKTPSFTVNNSKNFYHCFGCGEHGDIFSFAMKVYNLDYKTAIIKISEDFNIAIPKSSYNTQQKKEDNAFITYKKILQEISIFSKENILKKENYFVLQYLLGRGFTHKTIHDFEVGFIGKDYEELIKNLDKDFTKEILLKCGVFALDKNNKLYFKLYNRIIFPIKNNKNEIIAYGGRVTDNKLPKYLNSAETDYFKKNKNLYNLHEARKFISQKNYSILVEGYLDVMTLFQYGFKNVVAGLGTAISKFHIEQLFNLSETIIICFDGDQAGNKAAKRITDIAIDLIDINKKIKFVFLPENLDPDDFIKTKGKEKFEQLILNESITFSEALFKFTLEENKDEKITAENKAKIEDSLYNRLKLIKNNILRKNYYNYFKRNIYLLNSGKDDKNILKKTLANFDIEKNFKNISRNDLELLSIIIKFPGLINFKNDVTSVKDIILNNDEVTNLKDELINLFDEVDKEKKQGKIEDEIYDLILENSSQDVLESIKKILFNINFYDIELAEKKINILLLKNFLRNINDQYIEILNNSSHDKRENNNKVVSEIFKYKESIEKEISKLEKEIIL